jgi:hypothetical protein
VQIAQICLGKFIRFTDRQFVRATLYLGKILSGFGRWMDSPFLMTAQFVIVIAISLLVLILGIENPIRVWAAAPEKKDRRRPRG